MDMVMELFALEILDWLVRERKLPEAQNSGVWSTSPNQAYIGLDI